MYINYKLKVNLQNILLFDNSDNLINSFNLNLIFFNKY